MDQIYTTDIFRATYHLTQKNRCIEISLNEAGERSFSIKGEGLLGDDLKYCNGNANVNPLFYKETYRLLMEIDRKSLTLPQPYSLSDFDDGLELLEIMDGNLIEEIDEEWCIG